MPQNSYTPYHSTLYYMRVSVCCLFLSVALLSTSPSSMPNFSATSEPASSLQPPDGDGTKINERKNDGIAVDLAKRFLELESQIDRLKEENGRLCACNRELEDRCRDQRRLLEDKEESNIRIKEDGRLLTETVKRLEEKCERWKEKYETLRDSSECGDRKWKERLEEIKEKCWRLEVDNRKLQIDLSRGADGIEEMMEKMKAVERLLEEKDIAISEMEKKFENLEREKRKIEEELGHRVLKLEKSVAEWVHCTGSGTVKERTSGDTRIAMDDLGCNAQDIGIGDLKGSDAGPKSISMSTLIDPKKENLEGDEQLIRPVVENTPYAPKPKDVDIVEISDDEEEEKQSPPFASPSSAKCPPATKRKSEAVAYSAKKQLPEAKRCKSKLWEDAKQMCEAFNDNEELCIKSICALFRKHNSLGVWKNRLNRKNGFKSELAERGVALGKFLTDGDPEGRMKKSVADLVREDPKKGLFHCRFIAQNHHDVLFEIYSNNLDPFFLP